MKLLRSLSTVVLLTLGVAACGGGSGGTSSGSGTASGQASGAADSAPVNTSAPVTLTWWSGQPADGEKILEPLVKEFTTAHPNVTVKLSPGAPNTDELLQKITAGFASNTYPDISYAYGSWASSLADSGKTLDITAKVADPAVAWSEFPEAARQTASPGGRVIGFPAVVDDLSVLYNPTLFAAAGVPEPTPDWTWQDFRDAAKKITNPAKGLYGTAFSVSGSEGTTWQLWPQVWQNGGDVLSADGKKSAFNSQAGVDALEFWRAMAVDDKSVYLDQTDEKALPLFADGRMGMLISGPWALFDVQQKKTPYKVQILPGTNGRHTTVSGPDVWALFDHKDPARAYWSYQLVQWLTSKEIDARWNMAQGNLPLRESEKALPEYAALVKEFPGVDIMAANLANATEPRPTLSAYVEVSRFVGEAISATLQGQSPAKGALDTAAAKADPVLAGE
jgi:multiple sugar transport system substrate-binding protein